MAIFTIVMGNAFAAFCCYHCRYWYSATYG
ncbi:DUF979 domain-containing protein [Aliivibrio fischeri]|nr:DUF979 domain-containing protein [Aliivibrio fischeri]